MGDLIIDIDLSEKPTYEYLVCNYNAKITIQDKSTNFAIFNKNFEYSTYYFVKTKTNKLEFFTSSFRSVNWLFYIGIGNITVNDYFLRPVQKLRLVWEYPSIFLTEIKNNAGDLEKYFEEDSEVDTRFDENTDIDLDIYTVCFKNIEVKNGDQDGEGYFTDKNLKIEDIKSENLGENISYDAYGWSKFTVTGDILTDRDIETILEDNKLPKDSTSTI